MPRKHSSSSSSISSNGTRCKTTPTTPTMKWTVWLCALCAVCAVEPEPEVQIQVLFKPLQCDQRSKRGDLVNAHYDGFLAEGGTQFYCSRSDKEGHPQWFVLGIGQVIKGLDLGMLDMCPGEKRKITVPPALAFGEKGKDPVPPNASVVFEVEVYAVSRGPRSVEAFREMDLDRDNILTKEEVTKHLKSSYEKEGTPKDEAFYEKVMADIFHKSDDDRDGRLSAKEYNIYGHDEL